MDDRTVDLIFAGSLKSLPPVSSKIVRIFTSSTFTASVEINTLLHLKEPPSETLSTRTWGSFDGLFIRGYCFLDVRKPLSSKFSFYFRK
ncbi:hypothetical protein EVAR_33348_1 [Eumeta japonica]|uniref:Uncharacterized protein n=1 Tax=Eumeta variegata TaxID=151549 RepID=A0A4C1YLR7_EUMVA|nr:hypothetical protein EVAR_33348_1 [Eumeta japonica]